MSRPTIIAAVVVAFVLSSGPTNAQTVNRATLPQTPDRVQVPGRVQIPAVRDTMVGAGTGVYTVWAGAPLVNQSTFFGTAGALVWQNGNGVAITAPTTGMGAGTVNVYYAKDNTLLQTAIRQSCFLTATCTGPGMMIVVLEQHNPGSTTYYSIRPAKNITTSAVPTGGGISVITFQNIIVETKPTS